MYYMEYAIGKVNNRRKYQEVNNVINLSFNNKFKYIETWRSMFFYNTDKPQEGDFLCGNFYIESDNKNFLLNKNIIIDVCEYINKKYKIPFKYMNFFKTNKSIWLEIPFKVFGTFGEPNLHKIYKIMAKEINLFLKKDCKYQKTLDLSIYKWNSLIHSLGSYLPKIKQRVYKFSYWDLDNIYKDEDLLNIKWDYFFTYKDIETVSEAKQWFENIKKTFCKSTNNLYKENNSCNNYICMKKLEKIGLKEGERNNNLYSYTLYLKQTTNWDLKTIINNIQTIFKNNKYVFHKEAIRTIKSAYNGNKHFSCNYVKNNALCSEKCKKRISNNIYVPREFITLLNQHKCNWKCYYILLDLLYKNQIEKEDLKINIKEERHKKDFVKNIDILKKIGIIDYSIIDYIIYIKLCNFSKDIYKSYILIPKTLYNSKKYQQIGKGIKIFLELLRCSIITNNQNYYVNVKIKTLVSNLKSTIKNVKKHLTTLKKMGFLFSKYLILTNFKNNKYKIIKSIINKFLLNNGQTKLLSINIFNDFGLFKKLNKFLNKYNLETKSFLKLLFKDNIKEKLRFNLNIFQFNNILPKLNNS